MRRRRWAAAAAAVVVVERRCGASAQCIGFLGVGGVERQATRPKHGLGAGQTGRQNATSYVWPDWLLASLRSLTGPPGLPLVSSVGYSRTRCMRVKGSCSWARLRRPASQTAKSVGSLLPVSLLSTIGCAEGRGLQGKVSSRKRICICLCASGTAASCLEACQIYTLLSSRPKHLAHPSRRCSPERPLV